jgi:hypothetical protein
VKDAIQQAAEAVVNMRSADDHESAILLAGLPSLAWSHRKSRSISPSEKNHGL